MVSGEIKVGDLVSSTYLNIGLVYKIAPTLRNGGERVIYFIDQQTGNKGCNYEFWCTKLNKSAEESS